MQGEEEKKKDKKKKGEEEKGVGACWFPMHTQW
jgi:hypothetical protein